MPMTQRLDFLAWTKRELQRRDLSAGELLGHLREQIRRQVLAAPGH
jgi:hypothetical protein